MNELAALTWPEVAALECAVLVVPVGSTEQHGPHLPLDTDTRIAMALARRASAAHPKAVVGPPVAYGASGEHAGFPGTVSVGTTALARLLLELVRSAIPPFAAVVLVNGHGGNAAALATVTQQCQKEGRPVVTWTPRYHAFAADDESDAGDPGGGEAAAGEVAVGRDPSPDGHAGFTETSLLLAIEPAIVRTDRLAAGNTTPLAELLPQLRADGVAAHSPNGVLGDARRANAAAGWRLLDKLVADLSEVVRTAASHVA